MTAMNAVQLAALGRVLENADLSPVVRLMATASGVDYSQAKATALRIAREGMQLDEARAFIAGTDTPEERKEIVDILDSIDRDGTRADENTVLQWAWREAYLVYKAAPVVPVSSPGLAGEFAFRVGLPLFTYSWWTLRSQIPRILTEVAEDCARLGIPRGDIVFPMETHSDGGRPGAPVKSWKEHYSERMDAHPDVVNAIGAAGFGSLFIPWNDNTPGKGYARSWNKADLSGNMKHIRSVLVPAMQRIEWSRCLAAMCNEGYDTGLDDDLRQIAVDLHIPGDRLVASDDPRMGAKWHDFHFKDVNNLPALGNYDVAMSDNGGSIRQLYGTADIWNGKAAPQLDAHLKCLNRYVPGGKRIWFYGLSLEDVWTPYRSVWFQILSHYAKLRGYGAGKPAVDSGAPSGFDLSKVKFNGADISAWAATIKLSNVKFGDKHTTWDTDPGMWGAGWKPYAIGGATVCGNPWVFAYRDGAWRATTWEWCRVGCRDRETAKLREAFGGLKRGEQIALCLSGLARDKERNEQQRSNLVWATAP